jgi:hypothetical protein
MVGTAFRGCLSAHGSSAYLLCTMALQTAGSKKVSLTLRNDSSSLRHVFLRPMVQMPEMDERNHD